MKYSIVAAVMLCGFSGAAMAADPGPIPQGPPSISAPGAPVVTAPADAASANDDDTIVCRYERRTGTLFQTRICHTNRQWKQQTDDAHNLMDKLQQDSAGQPRGG